MQPTAMTPCTIHATLLLLCLSLPTATHSFASFFVDRSSACFLNLRDPQEVIMNAYLVQPEASPFSNSTLFVQVTPKNEEAPDTIANTKTVQSVFELDSTQPLAEYTVTLIYPQSELADLQYVVDVATLTLNADSSTEEEEKPKSLQASFLPTRKSGCHNTRVYGRGKDHETFTLQISTTDIHVHTRPEEYIHLVAAWATGHEAVKLTSPIYFIPKSSSSSEGEEEQEHDKKEPPLQLIHPHGKHDPNRVGEEPVDSYLFSSFRKKYAQESLGTQSFTFRGYLIGMILLIGSGIMTRFVLVRFSRTRNSSDQGMTWKER